MITHEIVFVVIIITGLLLPFSNRAFFIDDLYHFTVAEHILKAPLRPYDFTGEEITGKMKGWEKGQIPWLLNPPLMHYFLALSIKIFGDNLTLIRISFIIFPIISAISVYFLAKEFTDYALLTTLLTIFTPAFMVTSMGLLIDSVLLTFYLLTITLFIIGHNKNNITLLILSAFCMGLTMLIKYTGISVIFIIIFWIIYKSREIKNWKLYLIYFLIPILLFLMWSIWNLVTYGGIHIIECLKHELINSDVLWVKFINF